MSCTYYCSSSLSPCCDLVCKKTKTTSYYCCCEPNRRSSTALNSSLRDELELLKLRETNNELKYLINKLDTLSDSIDLKRKHAQPTVHTSCVCVRTDCYSDNKCNICTENSEYNRRNRFQYDVVVCDDCERMVNMAKKLDSSRTTIEIINTDSKIYPLTCEDCNLDHHRHRMDVLRRSRRSRSRSRELRRLSSDCSRSTSRSRAITPEPRPIWNSGPYTSSYLWRDWRLKECKKD
jgi:hypothetical protein